MVFPTAAPYRVDQVTAAPLAMAGLFLAQFFAVAAMSWAGGVGWRRLWSTLGGALLALVALFFTLASWGTSDPTKLSHYLPHDLSRVQGEPFWQMAAPLLVHLPYRMAAVHGLVVAGFAASVLLLAWSWRALAWGGWWALLICCSPLLRNFLQNGVSRQALATLLLLPLLVWAGRLSSVRRVWIVLGAFGSMAMHTAFVGSLPISLLPLLVGDRRVWDRLRPRRGSGLRGAGRPRLALLPLLAWLALFAGLLTLILLAVPTVIREADAYVRVEDYANSYSVSQVVQRLQLALGLGVLLTCWHRRLDWRTLLSCGITRQLALFGLLYHLVQASVISGWYSPITSRFADVVGFFLLIVFLAWLQRYGCHWAVLPALLVTLDYWLMDRLLGSRTLVCGLNDDFLCVPDRWPWQVRF
jgi:hypothetical protein